MPDDGAHVATHDLAALYPAPVTITIAGRPVRIERCTLRQGGRILDVGMRLYAEMRDGESFLAVFEERHDETTALIVAATGLDAEWVDGLDAIDQFELASRWVEVNGRFFARRLLPNLMRMGQALRELRGDGPTSSPSSSAAASPTPAASPRTPPSSSSARTRAPSAASGATA